VWSIPSISSGAVAEALEVLEGMSRPESPPIALSFEVTETCGGPSAANVVTITSVERDDFGIRVNYDTVPTLGVGSYGPRGEAKDDLGNDYLALGSHFGLTAVGGSTDITYGASAPTLSLLGSNGAVANVMHSGVPITLRSMRIGYRRAPIRSGPDERGRLVHMLGLRSRPDSRSPSQKGIDYRMLQAFGESVRRRRRRHLNTERSADDAAELVRLLLAE
jgi:hypothetical protein